MAQVGAIAQVTQQQGPSCIQAKAELWGNALLDVTLLTGVGASGRAAKMSGVALREARQAFRRGEYWTSSMNQAFKHSADAKFFAGLGGGAIVVRVFLQSAPFVSTYRAFRAYQTAC